MFATNTSSYYQPSGRAPFGGLIQALIVGIIAAFVLSIPYAYIIRYLPSMYLCVFATAFYGFALGWIVNRMALTGKIRSPLKCTIIALISGAAAAYFQWTMYLAILFHDSPQYPLLTAYSEFLNPANIIDGMREILPRGTWTLSRSSHDPVHGTPLAIVWIIEALILTLLPTIGCRTNSKRPFSEACDQWAPEEKLPRTLPAIIDISSTKIALENGDIGQLLTQAPADSTPCSEITLHTIDADPECQYLNLSNITVALVKGKEQRKQTHIVKNLRITSDQAQKLRAKFGPTTR